MVHLDAESVLLATGYTGLFCIVFAESGLFFGFFLPGDSLLFTAGFLASQKFFPAHFMIAPVILLFLGACVAAVLGDNVGFAFGRRVGTALFSKQDSLFFDKKY